MNIFAECRFLPPTERLRLAAWLIRSTQTRSNAGPAGEASVQSWVRRNRDHSEAAKFVHRMTRYSQC
jgi:hypothetical protein